MTFGIALERTDPTPPPTSPRPRSAGFRQRLPREVRVCRDVNGRRRGRGEHPGQRDPHRHPRSAKVESPRTQTACAARRRRWEGVAACRSKQTGLRCRVQAVSAGTKYSLSGVTKEALSSGGGRHRQALSAHLVEPLSNSAGWASSSGEAQRMLRVAKCCIVCVFVAGVGGVGGACVVCVFGSGEAQRIGRNYDMAQVPRPRQAPHAWIRRRRPRAA